MRSAAIVPACLVLAVGCAEPGLPPPCSPGAVPEIGQHQLVPPKGDAGSKAVDDEGAPKPEATAKAEAPSGEQASNEAPEAEAAAEGERDAKGAGEPSEAEVEATPGAEVVADAEPAKGEETPAEKDPVQGAPTEVTPAEPAEETPAEAEPGEGTPADAEPEPSAPSKVERFEAARDDVERSIDWLLCVVPYKLPEAQIDAWYERRDLVLDWIENHPTLGYTFSAAIMAPIHKDRKFSISMYMNFAYAVGKARYLLSTPTPDPIEAEVAALESVAQYYATFKQADPKLEARKLAKLMRKKKRGKLRPWIAKKLAGG